MWKGSESQPRGPHGLIALGKWRLSLARDSTPIRDHRIRVALSNVPLLYVFVPYGEPFTRSMQMLVKMNERAMRLCAQNTYRANAKSAYDSATLMLLF